MWESLRKFGLSVCDLPTMVWNLDVMLRTLAIKIDKRNKKSIPIPYYMVTAFGFTCYTYMYVFSMLWYVLVRSRETGDRLGALLFFSPAATGMIGLSKMIFMVMHQKTFRGIVEEYLSLDSSVAPGSRFARNLTVHLRGVKRYAVVYWCAVMINSVIYMTKALLTPGRHFSQDSLVIYGIEPMFESPNYEIAFFLDTVSVFFSAQCTTVITGFFITVAGYTEAHLKALSAEVSLIWEESLQQYKELRSNERFHITADNENIKMKAVNKNVKHRLEDVIKSHTMDIYLIRRIDNQFRGLMTVEFMLVIISMLAVLMCGVEERTIVILLFSLTPVAVDCFLGQKLTDASRAFKTAVYNCGWENFDKSNMKIVLIILLNTQREITLSVGGVSTLGYESFVPVIKGVYSAYTAIRSVLN